MFSVHCVVVAPSVAGIGAKIHKKNLNALFLLKDFTFFVCVFIFEIQIKKMCNFAL